MDNIKIEWELFCEISNRKPYILWVPTLWMLFCLGLMLILDRITHNLLSGPTSPQMLPLIEFVYNIIELRIVFIAGFALLSTLWLTFSLYTKERDRLY